MDLVIFDIDGTLVNSLNIDDNCFKETFSEMFGLIIEDKLWDEAKISTSGTDSGILSYLYNYCFTKPVSKEVSITFKQLFHIKLHSYSRNSPDLFGVIDGANKILKELKENNYALAIATGSWQISAKIKLGTAFPDLFVLPLAYSDNFLNRRDIIRSAILKSIYFYKIDMFHSITYIGDGIWDYNSCKELSINFIGIDSNGSGVLKNAGAEIIFKNHLDILDFLNTK